MGTFYEQIREMQEERRRAELLEAKQIERLGENVYIRYCIWCNAEGKKDWKKNGVRFGEYLRNHKIELDFWKKKAIAETHFGYKYSWDGKNWEIVKNES